MNDPNEDLEDKALFVVNEILAIIFFAAFYYSVKTIRNAYLKMNKLDGQR